MSDLTRTAIVKFPFPTPPKTKQLVLPPLTKQTTVKDHSQKSNDVTQLQPNKSSTRASNAVFHPPRQMGVEFLGVKCRRPLTAKKMDQFTCYNCCQVYQKIRLHPYSIKINRQICTTCVTSHRLFLLANIEPFTPNFTEEYLQCQQEKAQGLYD